MALELAYGMIIRRLMARLFRWLLLGLLAFMVLSVLWVILLRWVPAPPTLLMIGRQLENKGSAPPLLDQRQWVPLEQISPHLVQAVICSEDQNFMSHHGFDFKAIVQAAKTNIQGQHLRGGSTISQQTAKNVFCWQHRSWLRKGLETWFTVLIEVFWSKKRIMEMYLNVIEMGPHVYGAEKWARTYYNKPAAQLSAAEAALLAACLPSPRRWTPRTAPGFILAKRNMILKYQHFFPYQLEPAKLAR